MNRVWIPGWQFTAESLMPLMSEVDVEPSQVLSYANTPPTRAQWLAQTAEDLPKDCQLIGWSLGGMLACELAQLTDKVKQVLVLNANVQFAGGPGLPIAVAEGFMARYQRQPGATRKKFASLVDREQAASLTNLLLVGDHSNTLQWLYDIHIDQLAPTAKCYVLLAVDDQLVPFQSALAAWQPLAQRIDSLPGQHSLPVRNVADVARWIRQYG